MPFACLILCSRLCFSPPAKHPESFKAGARRPGFESPTGLYFVLPARALNLHPSIARAGAMSPSPPPPPPAAGRKRKRGGQIFKFPRLEVRARQRTTDGDASEEKLSEQAPNSSEAEHIQRHSERESEVPKKPRLDPGSSANPVMLEDSGDEGQEICPGSAVLSDEEMENEAAAVTVQKSVSQRVKKKKSPAEPDALQRRRSPRLQGRPEQEKPVYFAPRRPKTVASEALCVINRAPLDVTPPLEVTPPESPVSRETKAVPVFKEPRGHGNKGKESVKASAPADSIMEIDVAPSLPSTNPAARVKDTLRIFNAYFLYFVKEEENRCKRDKETKDKKGSKNSKLKKGEDGSSKRKKQSSSRSDIKAVSKGEDGSSERNKRSSRRPDLKAASKMMDTNVILYPTKQFGHLPGINVGDHFYSRCEMVAIGLHSHWLNGIDVMGVGYSRKADYKGYTFPLAVAIVLSGGYEDDVDKSEELIYTGQGGNDLLGNKRQVKDQKMDRGNLALKNNLDQGAPVRVIRGHRSANSYSKKIYTYDGLYKVVQYWAEKGLSGYTVYKFRLRRLEGQPMLTTDQVHFNRAQIPTCASDLRGLACEDISEGQEKIPVPASNIVDDPPVPPSGYTYITTVKVGEGVNIPPAAEGCKCKGECINPRSCSCARLNGIDFPYVRRDGGRLVEAKDVVFECGPNCACGPDCVNRTSQRGLKYRLEVFYTLNKGWAVRSWDFIPAGAPICEYTGILTRTDELDAVSENNFIFEIDCLQTMKGIDGRQRRLGDVSKHHDVIEKLNDKKADAQPEFCIDAGISGNVARFFNHSCEPNLFVQCILSSHHDIKLARIVLFAADNIPPLQELTYDYGYALDSVIGEDGKIKELPCYCGAVGCRKRLY